MKTWGLAVAAVALTSAITPAVSGGEVRTVRGTLEWPRTVGDDRFIVVRGDDGATLFVDITGARRTSGDSIRAGDRISVIGVEAGQPYVLQAAVIGLGDSALSSAPTQPPPVRAPATRPSASS